MKTATSLGKPVWRLSALMLLLCGLFAGCGHKDVPVFQGGKDYQGVLVLEEKRDDGTMVYHFYIQGGPYNGRHAFDIEAR